MKGLKMTIVKFLEHDFNNVKMFKEIIPFMDRLGNTIEELEDEVEMNVGEYNLYFRDRLFRALEDVGVVFNEDYYATLLELYRVLIWLNTVSYVVEDFDIQLTEIDDEGDFWLFSEMIDNIDEFVPFYSGLDSTVSYEPSAKEAYRNVVDKLKYKHTELLSIYSPDVSFIDIFKHLTQIHNFKDNVEFTEAVALISIMIEFPPNDFGYSGFTISQSIFNELTKNKNQ